VRAAQAKLPLIAILAAFLLALSMPSIVVADNLVVAANDGAKRPTLQQRRSAARGAEVHKLQRHCRISAQRLRSFQNRKCAGDDQLDGRTGLCHPRKGRYRPYLRWDTAAGRCKPRHRYDGGSCAGGKRRYNAGKHHAQSAAQSVRMYGKAPARAQASVNQCRRALTKLRRYGMAERAARQRDCKQAQALKRTDLIRLYCR
jgi:hypothetical protein